MRRIFILLILMLSSSGFCEDVQSKIYKKLQDYVYTEFGDYTIQAILPIPKSYMKNIEGKDFDEVKCKLKGSSNLYLYLNCDFMLEGNKVSSFPVTFRIKDGSKKVVIEKNKKVTILYVNKNLRVSLLGVALQNGKIGDYIEVKNISTGKVLKGKVISENEVLIDQ